MSSIGSLKGNKTVYIKQSPIFLIEWCEMENSSFSKRINGVWKRTTLGIASIYKNTSRLQLILVLVYRLSLDILYIWILSPLYANTYSALYTQIRPIPYLTSLFSIVLFAPFAVKIGEGRGFSSLIVTLFNYMYFLPLTSYYGCKGTVSGVFFLCSLGYWALLLLWQFRLPVLQLKELNLHTARKLYTGLTVISCMFILYISGRYTGFRLTLDFVNVYGIRAEAASYQIPGIFSYALNAMPVVMTLLLTYWIYKKKWIVAGLLIVVYLFMFSISANKTTFFLLILVLGVTVLYRPWMLKYISCLFIFLNVAEMFEYLFHGSTWIMTFFTRRMMFVPVSHSDAFFRFFSENPLNLFRDGIMGRFSFESLYSQNIPRVIGEYLNEYEMNANNGLLGDMFANLPILLGLFIMPLIIIICLRVCDVASKAINEKVLLPFAVYFSNSFINSSWSTVLLSHGFLLMSFLLLFYPREERELQ